MWVLRATLKRGWRRKELHFIYGRLEVGQFALWKLWRLMWLWLGFPKDALQLCMWLCLKPEMYRAPRLVGAKPMDLSTDDGLELDARL